MKPKNDAKAIRVNAVFSKPDYDILSELARRRGRAMADVMREGV